jgi:hypothetical protein
MATAIRNAQSRKSNRHRTVPVDPFMPCFVVELTEKDGSVTCWPETFNLISKARRSAKGWSLDSKFGVIASVRVRRVASMTFAD